MLSVIEHERMAVEFGDLEETGFSGAAGIDDGSPTPLHRAFRAAGMPNPESTLFDICSVTKSVTAAAILQLESKGCLSLDQTLDQFFDLPPEMAEITIHHVLMHSSGLGDFLSPTGEPREYSLEQDYEPLSRDDLLQQVRRSRLLGPPGERWSYSNTGYSLLAAIIEEITGEKFEGYLRRVFLPPFGMHDTGYTFPIAEHPRVAAGRLGSSEWGRPAAPPGTSLETGGCFQPCPICSAGGLRFARSLSIHAKRRSWSSRPPGAATGASFTRPIPSLATWCTTTVTMACFRPPSAGFQN